MIVATDQRPDTVTPTEVARVVNPIPGLPDVGSEVKSDMMRAGAVSLFLFAVSTMFWTAAGTGVGVATLTSLAAAVVSAVGTSVVMLIAAARRRDP